MESSHCALVIGLCSHGLSITRSLHAAGIQVHALEANIRIPGFRTASATVHKVNSIKAPSLVEDLEKFRHTHANFENIVLFPTNDINVRIVAENIEKLRELYTISWADQSDVILRLLSKTNIEERCIEAGLNYPRSENVKHIEHLRTAIAPLHLPIIVKPATPQSRFKVLKFANYQDAVDGLRAYKDEFPVVVQEWVEGTDKDIYFCALYLDHGRTIGSFVGRKLASHPPARGQTTVAINCHDKNLENLTEKFFCGLNISGPVSLEFKFDPSGIPWVIEPTVGRTDFWLGLCVASGFNLPLIEYEIALYGKTGPGGTSFKDVIWFDSERDPLAMFKYFRNWLPVIGGTRTPAFSYFYLADLSPFHISSANTAKRVTSNASKRLTTAYKRLASTDSEFLIDVYHDIDELPQDFKELFNSFSKDFIFYDIDWFRNFAEKVAKSAGKIEFFCLRSQSGTALAIFPAWSYKSDFHSLSVRKISGLANYYSPRFDLIYDNQLCDRSTAMKEFLDHIKRRGNTWDVIELNPMSRDVVESIRAMSKVSFVFYATRNYYQNILHKSFSEYLESRNSRHRKTIHRKRRKLERMGLYEFNVNLGGPSIKADLEKYHNVYLKSWKKSEPHPRFIEGLVELAARRDWLRMGTLKIDEKIVASQLWFVSNDTAYIYKLAYDPAYASYSPGTLLTAEIMRHVIDIDRVKKVDFLNGADTFKNDWMDSYNDLYGIQYPNPKSFRGLLLIIMNTASLIRRKLLRPQNSE